jgi:hypothetical protein
MHIIKYDSICIAVLTMIPQDVIILTIYNINYLPQIYLLSSRHVRN